MKNYIIRNAQVINEGVIERKDVYMKNNRFERIEGTISLKERAEEIDGENLYLLPGLIDDQVHFREPGLTHKATIETEPRCSSRRSDKLYGNAECDSADVKSRTIGRKISNCKT